MKKLIQVFKMCSDFQETEHRIVVTRDWGAWWGEEQGVTV